MGDVFGGGGGNPSQTVVQSSEPWADAKPFFLDKNITREGEGIYRRAAQLYLQGLQPWTGRTVAPVRDETLLGINRQHDYLYGPHYTDLTNNASIATRGLLGAADPNANPALNQAVSATGRTADYLNALNRAPDYSHLYGAFGMPAPPPTGGLPGGGNGGVGQFDYQRLLDPLSRILNVVSANNAAVTGPFNKRRMDQLNTAFGQALAAGDFATAAQIDALAADMGTGFDTLGTDLETRFGDLTSVVEGLPVGGASIDYGRILSPLNQIGNVVSANNRFLQNLGSKPVGGGGPDISGARPRDFQIATGSRRSDQPSLSDLMMAERAAGQAASLPGQPVPGTSAVATGGILPTQAGFTPGNYTDRILRAGSDTVAPVTPQTAVLSAGAPGSAQAAAGDLTAGTPPTFPLAPSQITPTDPAGTDYKSFPITYGVRPAVEVTDPNIQPVTPAIPSYGIGPYTPGSDPFIPAGQYGFNAPGATTDYASNLDRLMQGYSGAGLGFDTTLNRLMASDVGQGRGFNETIDRLMRANTGGGLQFGRTLSRLMSGNVNADPFDAATQAAQARTLQNFEESQRIAAENFRRDVIPAIRGEFQGAGTFGGSRHQLAAGRAGERFTQEQARAQEAAQRELADIATNIYIPAFTQAQDLAAKAAGLGQTGYISAQELAGRAAGLGQEGFTSAQQLAGQAAGVSQGAFSDAQRLAGAAAGIGQQAHQVGQDIAARNFANIVSDQARRDLAQAQTGVDMARLRGDLGLAYQQLGEQGRAARAGELLRTQDLAEQARMANIGAELDKYRQGLALTDLQVQAGLDEARLRENVRASGAAENYRIQELAERARQGDIGAQMDYARLVESSRAAQMGEGITGAQTGYGLLGDAVRNAYGAAGTGVGLAPQVAQMALQPHQFVQGMGDTFRQFDQENLANQIRIFDESQRLPWQNVNQFSAILNANPGFYSRTGTQPGGGSNTALNVLGGGLLGATLGGNTAGLLYPAGSSAIAATSPWLTGIGGLLGAGLGLLL